MVKLLDAETAAALEEAFESVARELAQCDEDDYEGEYLAEALRQVRGQLECFHAREVTR